MPFVGNAVEKAGIDDAVGAFAVHGYCGVFGSLMVGIFARAILSPTAFPRSTFWGQLVGAVISAVLLGFIPGYGVSFLLKKFGLLRVSEAEEIDRPRPG
jgi:ammonium transporter, Amt family